MATRIWPGRPYPLGATWDGSGTNFALYSEHATKVELCLFDQSRGREGIAVHSICPSRPIWSGTPICPTCCRGRSTAIAFTARTSRPKGIASIRTRSCSIRMPRRSPARANWADEMFGYKLDDPQADLSFDERDNAEFAPLGAVLDEAFTWGDDRRPQIPWNKTIIYEMHVKGFTKLHPEVPENLRGTYAGLSSDAAIRYLRTLGITSVELLPVHDHVDDRHLVDRGLVNYWGYNTLGFLRSRAWLCVGRRRRRRGPRIQDDGPQPALGRHRGDSRRGLQPHGRRQPARADALVPRHRQRLVLPAVARRSAVLHGLHRLRQHVQHAKSRACCS